MYGIPLHLRKLLNAATNATPYLIHIKNVEKQENRHEFESI